MKNDNILIQVIILVSEFLMKTKKTKSKPKSAGKRTTKKKIKNLSDLPDYPGIVLIDDDLEIDTEKELEERKAYLEEARSQDTSD